MDLKGKIDEVAVTIQRLDRAFNFYFTGFEKRPPLKMYERLQREIKKLHDMADEVKNTADRYMIQMLVSRFSTYRIKWDRGLRAIEDGRTKPGTEFFGGIGKDPKALGEKVPDFDEIADKGEAVDEVEMRLSDAAKRYVALARAHMGKMYDPESIKQMLETKIPEMRKKFGDDIEFEVYFDGEKVRVKPGAAKNVAKR
ncbi:MAG TPA: hypothetical protein PLV42_00115 [bacterium]|nr:hypothetical protein [bacterium]